MGDKTINICDGDIQQGFWNYSNGNRESSSEWVTTKKLLCKEGTAYSFSCPYSSYRFGFAWWNTIGQSLGSSNTGNNTTVYDSVEFTATAPAEATYLAVNIGSGVSGQPITPEDAAQLMIVEGSTLPAEFIHYGYKIPVTVANGIITQIEDIYLNTPLSVSGNSADYIDYKTQKRYNADNT